MIKAAAIVALSIPVLCAAATSEYEPDLQATRRLAETWQNHLSELSAELDALGVELTAQSATAEIPETEDTVAVADAGMFFDTENSRLVYLGNVRLRDARAHLNAREQLHIHLQDLTPEDRGDKVQPQAVQTEGPISGTPDSTEEKPLATSVPAVIEEEAATAPSPAEKPALINTHSAIADSVENTVLLYAPAAGEDICMQQGENVVRISPGKTTPARILADPQGNILLEGELVDLKMTDKNGGVSTMKTSGGLAYYHAATHTLHAPGNTLFTHPDGTLSCTDSLCVVLEPAEQQKPAKKGFMSQFTAMRFNGVSTAEARGHVVLTGVANGKRPAMRAAGETLTYNGKTGECTLLGNQSQITYGGYDICSNEGIYLLANGDIEVRGDDISGTYEREGEKDGMMLKGSFKAHSHVNFRADTGTITTEKGLTMADAEADFSCTGPAQLVLSPKENARLPEQKPGMPNLAIARYGDISKLRAQGNVAAHRYQAGTHKCIGELEADIVESDLTTGETKLSGEPGKPLVALYDGNRIEATAAPGQVATMQMLANGDLKLDGETINTVMVNEDGTTTAKCRDYVRLYRAEDKLETGSATELRAPTAILTTNEGLTATLAASGKAAGKPHTGRKGIPHFQFDYNGIKDARTAKGCTLRTEQGSMQCTGPVHLVMDPEKKAADSDMGGLKHATAAGNVAIAGKDNTGRLLRATGDLLVIDAATGTKVLSGNRVTVGDADNTHIVTGKGAAIRIDAKNNVNIVGGNHKTHASNVRKQLNKQDNTKSKK